MLIGCGCAAKDSRVQEIKTAQDLKTRMDAGNVEVVHALDAENYAKGHIPGAVNIEYEKMTPEQLPSQKDKPLIFYCASPMCPVSKMAANKAVNWGYTQVSIYEGGMSGWKNAGMPIDKGK
jgi:rhodanese-related sulfurtransferase